MAHIRVPCLVSRTAKNGIESWYWQPSKTLAAAGWKPVALGKDRTAALRAAEVRNTEVAAWKDGSAEVAAHAAVRQRQQTGTLGALINRYRREVLLAKRPDGRDKIRAKTRVVYETSLKRLEAWAGNQPLAFVTPARVRALRDAAARPIDPDNPAKGGLGHAAAFNLLRQLRQVFAFAESVDLIPKGSNPAATFDLGAPPARRQVWEADDEAAFVAAAYDLGQPGMALAIELALYTAQREGDLIAMTEAQLQELEIYDKTVRDRFAGPDGKVRGWCFAQAKTSTEYQEVRMAIPFEPVLLARIEAAIRANRARDRAADPPRLLTHVLVDARTGLPWVQRAFISAWRKVIDHAVAHTGREAMRGLVWHDLRRTRVVRLRRRGMPKEMIASITGHSLQAVEEMLKVYGPVDAPTTAAALASTLDPLPVKDKDAGNEEQCA